MSEEELRDVLQNGLKKFSLNMHSWLTLPSMEILDFTILTTIAHVKQLGQGYFGVISRHPNDLIGMSYHPMLLGDDFLRRIGVLIEI